MRRLLALLLACATLAACSTSHVLPALGTLPASSGTETPLSATSFSDSIGVELHLTVDGPYASDFAVWAPILIASGIKHVRDGICPSYFDRKWCTTSVPQHMEELGKNGIKFDLVTSMNDPFAWVQQYATAQNIEQIIDSYEGPNECDASADCPTDWKATEASWQQQIYSLQTPDVKIIAPSMTTAAGYSALGNIAGFADLGNIHDYPAAYPPESQTVTPLHLQWATSMTGSLPVWSTEVGYSTDPTHADNGVPQVVQERYLPRLLLEHLRLGVMRTYLYQLFDYGPDGGKYMGLLNPDYSPKPAWTRLLQLMRLLADSGPAPQTPLAYSISGDSNGTLDHLLFQRSDGSYVLALWLAQPVYDPSTRTVLAIASETVSVRLPASVASATLTAYGDNGTVATSALTGTSGSFPVPARSTVSVLEFRV